MPKESEKHRNPASHPEDSLASSEPASFAFRRAQGQRMNAERESSPRTPDHLTPGTAQEHIVRLEHALLENHTAHTKSIAEIAAHKKNEKVMRINQANLEIDALARTTQLQQLTARLMNLQDEERRHLARELHDSAGQFLAAIQMSLGALNRSASLADGDRLKVSDALDMAQRCSAEIRTMSYLLHPPLLDEMGLTSALSMYVEGFAKRSGIDVELDIPIALGKIPVDIELALFRVVQQSLANIHRHSGSDRAHISVKMDAEQVFLVVRDDGKGIPEAKLKEIFLSGKLAGVGIPGMRERVAMMGGSFEMESSPNGTLLEVGIPVGAFTRDDA